MFRTGGNFRESSGTGYRFRPGTAPRQLAGQAGPAARRAGPARGSPAPGSEAAAALLDRVRKLLTKAESDGVTAAEAEALTAKAAELMAKYGIDRALLAARRPETDHPADRKIDIDNPWARVQAHLLCGLASALRCQCVLLPRQGPGTRIHIFGFASDIERTDVLYTSLLLQMWQGLAVAQVPDWSRSPRAWRRSWLLGFISAVVSRVRAAEQAATSQATSPAATEGAADDAGPG